MGWRMGLGALADLVFPPTCAGCGEVGATWCAWCRAGVLSAAYAGGARRVRPSPCPRGFPPTWAFAPYDGVLREALVAYKDRDRRDLAPVLAPLLRASLRACLADLRPGGDWSAGPASRPHVAVVAVPSSRAARRRRGDAPLDGLLRHVARLPGGGPCLPSPSADVLRLVRAPEDQAGLDARARAANLAGSLAARPPPPGAARPTVVVVDDVVTTGSTLAEASRVLGEAGWTRVAAACVAATERRLTYC